MQITLTLQGAESIEQPFNRVLKGRKIVDS